MTRLGIVFLFFFVALAVFAQGCYTLNQVGTSEKGGIELTNSGNAITTGEFTAKKWVNHFLFGLVSPPDAGVEKLILETVRERGGTRAVNVRVEYQMTFVNGLLNALTMGIYNPFTLTVTGEIVK